MTWGPLLACIVAASLLAGCTVAPGRGSLVPHGHLEVSANRSIVTVHLDFYNEGDLPIEFPRHPTGEAETAYLVALTLKPGDPGDTGEGEVLDGPTGVGPGATEIFNGSDVIAPRSWWNTTFHVKYHPPLDSPWLFAYSAHVKYREQNEPEPWRLTYFLPCYGVDGKINTTFAPDHCGNVMWIR